MFTVNSFVSRICIRSHNIVSLVDSKEGLSPYNPLFMPLNCFISNCVFMAFEKKMYALCDGTMLHVIVCTVSECNVANLIPCEP